MKKAKKIVVFSCLFLATAIVFFLIGAGVAVGYGAKALKVAVPTFEGVRLEDDLTADGFGVVGPVLICGIKSTFGTTPDRVVVEYTDQRSDKQLASKTVEVRTNDRGGRYVQDTIPRFDNLVIVHIKRQH
jgi:hypothetical protein